MSETISRRDVLAGSGALLTSAMLGSQDQVEAQSPPSNLIDVHHHFLPPSFMKYTASIGVNIPPWTPESALAILDKNGFASGVLSISSPGVEPPDLCRQANDFGAKLVSDYPRRFGLFATLPLPAVDAALKELTYALDTLHADGIVLLSHYGEGTYLGDQKFVPLMEELNRRKVVVFVHPHTPWYQVDKVPVTFAGWGIPELPFDTTRAVLSLLAEDIAIRFPDIRFIFAHGGGAIAFLLSRVGLLGSRTNGFKSGNYEKLTRVMNSFYYDLTNTVRPPSIAALRALAPASKMMFGTDFPYGDGRNQDGAFIREMLAAMPTVGFSQAEQAAIGRGNAVALFPRLSAQRQSAA